MDRKGKIPHSYRWDNRVNGPENQGYEAKKLSGAILQATA